MEINKKHTLFGERASRVTTDEAHRIFDEIRTVATDAFGVIGLTQSLPIKTDHGDVDLVYVPAMTESIESVLSARFGRRILASHKNGDVYSILFRSADAKKDVHVDFIRATSKTFLTKLQYFSYNDFSGIFGMLAKKYGFKYGSEGFFKRYRDSKGNYHDIPVSYDLTVGLEMLGYDPDAWLKMTDYDDIVSFMQSSPMFDYRLFEHDSLNQSDKKSYKRPVIKYVVDKLRESKKTATITDADHFFKDTTAHHFCEIQKLMIEDNIAQMKLERERRLTNDSNG